MGRNRNSENILFLFLGYGIIGTFQYGFQRPTKGWVISMLGTSIMVVSLNPGDQTMFFAHYDLPAVGHNTPPVRLDHLREDMADLNTVQVGGLVLRLRAWRYSRPRDRELAEMFIQAIGDEWGFDPYFLPELPWDQDVIKAFLPHRGPHKLLLDTVTEISESDATGTYRVTDKVCEGHFGVFRGTDRVEAIQLLGAVTLLADPKYRGMHAMAWEIAGPITTQRPAVAGDIVELSVEFTKTAQDRRGIFVTGNGLAKVDKKVVCSVTGLTCILVPMMR